MDSQLTIRELEDRWEKALQATRIAVAHHSRAYRQLKALAADIVGDPIDINDYFPAVEQLATLLKRLDPGSHGSIFHIFNNRISPTSIWQVKLFRMECKDLLAHLKAFDAWCYDKHRLRVVK